MAIASLNWPSGIPRVLWTGRTCPRCSSFEFRTAEHGFLDGPLRMFFLQPVRCANCWRRYYWFHGEIKKS
jgi:hypothetical protein